MVAPVLVLLREFCSCGFEIIDTQLAQAWPRGNAGGTVILLIRRSGVADLHAT
jgi:hypothetical protein